MPPQPTPPALPARYQHPQLILAICCMSLLLVSMDVTIVNVALPAIQRNLHASLSQLQWILDAYTLVVASLLMLSGSISDRLGRRRIFQTGLVLFTAGSVLCSTAPTIHALILFRALQGLGASMLNPVALSIIANSFHDQQSRARAVGIWAAVAGFSFALGPVLGGALTQTLGWRSIFWINLPIGLLAFVLAARYVPESRAPRARAFDPLGQLLLFLTLAALTYGVIEGPHAGWLSPAILGLLAVSAASLVGFLLHESRLGHRSRRLLAASASPTAIGSPGKIADPLAPTPAPTASPSIAHLSTASPSIASPSSASPSSASPSTASPSSADPLLDLRFFRSIPFASATILAVGSFASFAAFLFLNAIYLQQVRGFSALHTGLCTLPLALAMILCAPISGRLVGTRGTLPSLLTSGLAFLSSTLLLTQLTATTPLPLLLTVYALFGLGLGMINPAIASNAVEGMPRSQAGVAAAIASTSRQIGAALGIALAGTIVSTARRHHLDFTHATHPIYWLMVAASLITLVLAWASNTPHAKASAAAVAHLIEAPATP
jgi:MFS family permease